MFTVASLWRHPIKSHGREALDVVQLIEGQTMPFDRTWAVTHEKTQFKSTHPQWETCRNFMIGSMNPALAGIWAQYDDADGVMHLRHQDIGEISFDPTDRLAAARFLEWVAPLTAHVSMQPTAIVSAGTRGMTDTPYPSISVMNMASNAAVADHLGHPLEIERWRGNIWLDGMAAWQEWDIIGHDLQIGNATLRITDPCLRCNHTRSNPVTGIRDVETLNALNEGWNHNNFGVYGTVMTSGHIALGDTAKVL